MGTELLGDFQRKITVKTSLLVDRRKLLQFTIGIGGKLPFFQCDISAFGVTLLTD
jgi:hypothetical protein